MKYDSNILVNGMWIGKTLSSLEILTIESFLANGHQFILWAYDTIITPLPQGVKVLDANQILDEKFIFKYKNANEWGHGKGSYAGFSDIFRYKLLYEKGGWWVDMDVTCLKPLDFEEDYFFRGHDILDIVGNVIKCPQGSQLMKDCFEESIKVVTEDNKEWFLPIRILNYNVKKYDLLDFKKIGMSNLDRWEIVEPMLSKNNTDIENWYFIHWLNEEWRSQSVSKEVCIEDSVLGGLHRRYQTSYPIKWISNPKWKEEIKLILANFSFSLKRRKSSNVSLFRDLMSTIKLSCYNYYDRQKKFIYRWNIKYKNWLKNPGVPVFVKKWFK